MLLVIDIKISFLILSEAVSVLLLFIRRLKLRM